jgi:pyridoxal phosphate enzyme (YggS family)
MIAENIKILRNRIAEISIKANRDPADIQIIAVSKNFGINEITEASKAGIIDFGENKVQELDTKFAQLGNKLTWHFLGHLQRNKVRFAVNSADYIHSVDSLMIAIDINSRAEKINKIQKILLQVKTTNEETKSGLTDESEIMDIAWYCKELKNVELKGFMTIGPLTDDREAIRRSFRYMSSLRDSLKEDGLHLKELSMGMTSDYDIAIEEGATMLRIGTAIFGERNYSNSMDEK